MILFRHGFEGGGFGVDPETSDEWTSVSEDAETTITVQDIIKNTGVYAAEAQSYSFIPSISIGAYCSKTLPAQTTLFTTTDLYIASWQYTGAHGVDAFFRYHNPLNNAPANWPCYLGITTRSIDQAIVLKLRYFADGTMQEAYSQKILNLNQWYTIQLEMTVATAGQYKINVDGIEELSVTDVNNSAVGDITSVDMGLIRYTNVITNLVFDNAVFANDLVPPPLRTLSVTSSPIIGIPLTLEQTT